MSATAAPADALKEDMLRASVAALAEGQNDAALALLDRLTTTHLDLDARPSDLTFHIFASALARRVEGDRAERNLYLRRFDLSQISLFNLLAERLPIVRLGGALANEVLAAVLPAGSPAVLLDVGIGTGQQEVALIEMLARRQRLPSRLHVLAIEPSPTSAEEAERDIRAAAAAAGLSLDFTLLAKVAEALDDAAWARCAAAIGDAPLVVNAAFAAHHIQGPGADGARRARVEVLRRLRAHEPHAVVLVEPNSDHDEPDFAGRFERCFWHYGAVFRLIDRLDLDERDRAAMKLFFAREIDDVLANAEAARTERHEPVGRWVARLRELGLHPAGGLEALEAVAEHGVSVVTGEGYAGLAVDGELLVAVICAGAQPLELDVSPPSEGAWPAVSARATAALGRLCVGDVMDTEPATISDDATLADAAEQIWRTGASDLAVLDAGGRFVGVLAEGDIVRRLLPSGGAPHEGSRANAFELLVLNGRHAAPQPLAPLVIRDPVVFEPADDLLLVATEMVRRQIRRLPVVTEDGALVGSISRADVCRALLSRPR